MRRGREERATEASRGDLQRRPEASEAGRPRQRVTKHVTSAVYLLHTTADDAATTWVC